MLGQSVNYTPVVTWVSSGLEKLVRKRPVREKTKVLDLDRLVLRLNRRRRGGEGELITLNTLLRLGADLVLDKAAELSGETEEELGRSLGR
jgi:hypothetical protein